MEASNPLKKAFDTYNIHPDDQNMFDRIEARYSHTDENGCVFVTGGKNSNGRPQIGADYRKFRVARLTVATRDGLNIRSDLWDACHTCHNPECVNPDHLIAESRQSNALDMYLAGTVRVGERHPRSGFTDDQVREIHSLQHTMSQARIAGAFNTTAATISRILSGQRYPHIFDEIHNA